MQQWWSKVVAMLILRLEAETHQPCATSYQWPGHSYTTSGGKCKGDKGDADKLKDARTKILEYCALAKTVVQAQKRQKLDSNPGSITSSFAAQRGDHDPVEGHLVVFKFLAAAGIAPNMLARKEWRDMVEYLRKNPKFALPGRKDFGTIAGVIAPVFQGVMDRVEKSMQALLVPCRRTGVTLVSDAGTNKHRCTLATALQFPDGGAHVLQQTDATGHKKDATYIMFVMLPLVTKSSSSRRGKSMSKQ